MRLFGRVLLASAFVLGACGGDAAETPVAETQVASADAAAPAAAPAATPVATAPVSGTIHTVQMLGDAQGYRFEPKTITIKPGDGIRWVNVSGGPHNVAFEAGKIPSGADAVLTAGMQNVMGPLMGPFLTTPNAEYTVSFANAPAGTYSYNCTPHLAMGMVGEVIVQP